MENKPNLDHANWIKSERAKLTGQVKNGFLPVSALVINNPPCLQNMTLYDLLRKQSRWGRKRSLRFLVRVGIGEAMTVGKLTWRQRNLVADVLEKK